MTLLSHYAQTGPCASCRETCWAFYFGGYVQRSINDVCSKSNMALDN